MKININKNVLTLIAGAALFMNTVGYSVENTRDESEYIGLLFGSNSYTNSTTDSSPTIGITLGTKLMQGFGIGLFGSYYGQQTAGNFLGLPTGTDAKTFLVTAQANGYAGVFHADAEIGAAMSSWSGNISSLSAKSSADALVFGPQAGVDFNIANSITY